MLLFKQKKAMTDFYDQHKAFLYWYLEKHSNLSEKLYYLLIQHITECLKQDMGDLIRLNEYEQRKWIINHVDEFTESEK